MWSQLPVFRCPYCGRLCVLATIGNQCDDGTLVRCPLHPTKYDLALLPGHSTDIARVLDRATKHDKALDSD